MHTLKSGPSQPIATPPPTQCQDAGSVIVSRAVGRPSAVVRLGRLITDLLFPPRCLGCNRLGSFYCGRCRAAIVPVTDAMCPACRNAVDVVEPVCKCHRPALLYVRAAGEYTGPLRHAIHRFKYGGQRAAARDLAALLASGVHELAGSDAVVVPVPLHPQREHQRGYNQSALLARAVAGALPIMVDEHAICRVKATPAQVGLRAADRAHNLRGAFVAITPACAGKDIVLIDDVCTTGATLRAAAQALRAAGARRVRAAVLALAVPGSQAGDGTER